jgi:hypothetical protein
MGELQALGYVALLLLCWRWAKRLRKKLGRY